MAEDRGSERQAESRAAETIRPSTASAVDDLVAKIRGLISDEGLKVGDNLPTESAERLGYRAGRVRLICGSSVTPAARQRAVQLLTSKER